MLSPYSITFLFPYSITLLSPSSITLLSPLQYHFVVSLLTVSLLKNTDNYSYIKTEEKNPIKTKPKQKEKKTTIKQKKTDTESKLPSESKHDLEYDKPQNNKKYLSVKQKIEEILDKGEGEIKELAMSKETFLKIYEKFLISDMRMLSLKKGL